MLYFLIVLCAMFFVETMTISVSLITNSYSLVYAIIAPIFVNFYVIVVLAFLALSLRFLLPKRWLNYQSRYFKTRDFEIKKLQNLGIKKWKDKVPEMGWTAGFPKDKLKSLDHKYLAKFLQETCFAEIMHNLAAVLGFTVLFFFPLKYYYFVLPILFVNLFLHLLPCLIQRYTRYRLAKIYELQKTKDGNTTVEDLGFQSEKAV